MEENKFVFYSGPIRFFEAKDENGEINYFTEGHVSTHEEDLVGDIVTQACMDDMLNQFTERRLKVDLKHETIRGDTSFEKELNKTLPPRAKNVGVFRDSNGIFVRDQLNKDHPGFKELKSQLKNEFFDAYSIAYIPVKTSNVTGKDGKEKRLLEKVNLINYAYTGNPIQPNAKIKSVFAKSLEYIMNVEGKDKLNQAKSGNIGGIMTDKKDEKLTAEQKDKIEIKSLEDVSKKFDSIDVEMKSISEKLDKIIKPDKKGDDAPPTDPPTPTDPPADPPADPTSTELKSAEELKSLVTRVKELEKSNTELKGFFDSPMYKSIREDISVIEKKSATNNADTKTGPLDAI